MVQNKARTTTRLYVALSKLNRREWATGTVCSICVNSFELMLRECLRGEGGDTIGAHVSLYFENATQEMIDDNWQFETTRFDGDKSSFFIDILESSPHTVSYPNDPRAWYSKWSWISVELYEVKNVTLKDVKAAQHEMLRIIAYNRPYDCCINVNSLFPSFLCYCGNVCFCCQCWAWNKGRVCFLDGVNCVSAVLIGLEAAKGSKASSAQRTLGMHRRRVLGSWLPTELLDELIRARVLERTPRILDIHERREFYDEVEVERVKLPLLTISRF